MQRFRHFGALFAVAMVFAATLYQPQPAQAQDAWISIRVTKAGFVVGVTTGSGVLRYRDRNYRLDIGGLRVGLTIGASAAELSGAVYYLSHPTDIEGTYSALQASAALGSGGNAIVLQNEKGVRLELEGTQAGIEASLDVGGMVISLQ